MERQTVRTPKKSKPKNSDYLVRLISVQLTICAAIFALLFVSAKLGGDTIADALNEYKRLTQDDFGIDDLKTALSKGKTETQPGSSETTTQADNEDAAAPLTDDETVAGTTEESPTAPSKAASNTAGAKAEQVTLASPLSYGGAASTSELLQSLLHSEPVLPVANTRVTSSFGMREHPLSGDERLHAGTDFGADTGERVMAVLDGKVTRATYSSSGGNYIVIDHGNGMETYYCHNSKLLVKEGTVVRAGETIALAGSTGDSTGPHVHLEVHVDGVPKDPMKVLFSGYAL